MWLVRKIDHCEFLRKLFDVDFPCCASCHEEYEWGLKTGTFLPMCEHGGMGEDIPFLRLCCAFNHFMDDLTEEQKQKIRDNYDKFFHSE